MVKRWKQEIILALTVLLCATGGGYLGGRMALLTAPVQPAASECSDIFGSLPPAEGPLAKPSEQPTVIVIVMNPGQEPQRAVYQLGRPLNQIQNPVNFI